MRHRHQPSHRRQPLSIMAPAGGRPPSIPRSPRRHRSRRSASPASAGRHGLDARAAPAASSRTEPAATQLIDGQGLPLAHQPGAKAVQVSKAGHRRMTAPGPGDLGKTGLQVSLPHHRQLAHRACTCQPPALPLTIKPLENARSAARPGVAAVRCMGADYPHLRPSRPRCHRRRPPRRPAATRCSPCPAGAEHWLSAAGPRPGQAALRQDRAYLRTRDLHRVHQAAGRQQRAVYRRSAPMRTGSGVPIACPVGR
jgi:hypothetical protein